MDTKEQQLRSCYMTDKADDAYHDQGQQAQNKNTALQSKR